jgi:hypothetical protein
MPVTENDVIVPESLLEEQERVIELQASAAKTQFDAAIGATQIDGEWRIGRGMASEVLRHHADASDLVIVGQANPETADSNDVPEGVLQDTGRPTLIVPYAGVGPGDDGLVLNLESAQSRSMHIAMPMPPPMQSVARPFLASRLPIS